MSRHGRDKSRLGEIKVVQVRYFISCCHFSASIHNSLRSKPIINESFIASNSTTTVWRDTFVSVAKQIATS